MIRNVIARILILVFLPVFSCTNEKENWVDLDRNVTYKVNFETPQGGILSIEAAYRSKNIDEILRCKDFQMESLYMLKYELEGNQKVSEEMIRSGAKALELAFINEIKTSMPDFREIVKSEFTKIMAIDGSFTVLEEECTYKDHGKSLQKLVVGKGKNGWKMLSVYRD